jgi:hypothetical protein
MAQKMGVSNILFLPSKFIYPIQLNFLKLFRFFESTTTKHDYVPFFVGHSYSMTCKRPTGNPLQAE